MNFVEDQVEIFFAHTRYTKDDLLNDTSSAWKDEFKQYEYVLVADVTEYPAHAKKSTKVGHSLQSGKNGVLASYSQVTLSTRISRSRPPQRR